MNTKTGGSGDRQLTFKPLKTVSEAFPNDDDDESRIFSQLSAIK